MQVMGQLLLPGAALFEIAIAAAGFSIPASSPAKPLLADAIIPAPFVLPNSGAALHKPLICSLNKM